MFFDGDSIGPAFDIEKRIISTVPFDFFDDTAPGPRTGDAIGLRQPLPCGRMGHANWAFERSSMNITVKNTTPDTARITLVGELRDGSFDAKVMAETDVPYTPYWQDQVEQRIVYIQPDGEQLKSILTALNERRLSLDELQNYGSSAGGTSSIPV